MTPRLSLLHATRGRPQKAVAAYRMWHERARGWASELEHIFSTDFDDATGGELYEGMLEAGFEDRNWHIIQNANKGSAEAWDNAYKASHGELLVQVSDDMEPPQDWAELLAKRIRESSAKDFSAPVVVAVSDGFRKDRLMTTFICTRAYADFKGEFIHSGFVSMFSDDDVSYRAARHQRDGRCTVIEARDLVFLHRHHYHDKTVPMDETYARQNADSAYRMGAQLFKERNPEAYTKDRRLWQ
jgi:hypothetical protein